MKAFELRAYDGPDGLTLTETDPPIPTDDELLIDVTAIGINFPDLLMTRGEYQLKPELPVVPGCEVAGIVRSAPADSGWEIGDRASAFIWKGAYAEQAVIPVATAARIPDDIDLITAAAMVVNYHTVLFALDRRACLQPGEEVLILGAAGGIGTAAAQVAKSIGAHVIAGVATIDQISVALDAGADEVVVLERGYSVTIREMLGRGVDVVVDPLGDWLFDEAIRCLDPEGRVVVIGFAAGEIPSIAVNRLLLRNVSVVGAAFGAFLEREPALIGRQGARLAEFAAAGTVRPQIEAAYAFVEIPSILKRLGDGQIRGKAVATIE